MPLRDGRPPQPSFEDFVEHGNREEIGKKIVDHLDEAEARVKAGIDPMPPYEEGTDPNGNIRKIMESRNQSVTGEVIEEDKEK